MRKALFGLLIVLGLSMSGDSVVLAARCTPLKQGKCYACKNCRYCGHCAKAGGLCSVCKRR